MAYSRISRVEERRTKKQLLIVLVGTIGLLVLVFTVGIPLVVGLSVAIGHLKSREPLLEVTDKTAPFPPTLAPLATATNSATLKLSGFAEPESTLTLYINGSEVKKVLVAGDGEFVFTDLTLDEGSNMISAISVDQVGNESKESAVRTIIFKKNLPALEVNEPQENQSFDKNSQEITVFGKTDVGNRVTLNDRFVPVRDDGAFSYRLRLSDGENTLNIVATDTAGNTTKLERKVIYVP